MAGALDEIAVAWGEPITLAYAGSATLARQVEAGAPADIVILANADWMAHLEDVGAVSAETVQPILSNHLILAGPTGSEAAPDMVTALTGLPESARIASGFTEAVPVGIYARQMLQGLGLWDRFEPRLVQVENARLALAMAARGDVAAALIYRSDAGVEPRAVEIAVADPQLHDPIRYVAARTSRSNHGSAAGFLMYLRGPEADIVFASAGYARLP